MEVFISSEELNEEGMVIDFKKLKEIVSFLIDKWDHVCLLEDVKDYEEFGLPGVLSVPFNPTAENMSKYLHGKIVHELENDSLTVKVRIHETDTGWAEYGE